MIRPSLLLSAETLVVALEARWQSGAGREQLMPEVISQGDLNDALVAPLHSPPLSTWHFRRFPRGRRGLPTLVRGGGGGSPLWPHLAGVRMHAPLAEGLGQGGLCLTMQGAAGLRGVVCSSWCSHPRCTCFAAFGWLSGGAESKRLSVAWRLHS